MKRLMSVVAVIPIAFALSGCTPLDAGGTPGFPMFRGGEVCAPLEAGGTLFIGDVLPSPEADITVRDVQLIRADGLSMGEAYVIANTGAIIAAEYPPAIPELEDRVPARGTTVKAGDPLSVAVIVERGEAPGHAEGIRVVYEVAGVESVAIGGMQYDLVDRCS